MSCINRETRESPSRVFRTQEKSLDTKYPRRTFASIFQWRHEDRETRCAGIRARFEWLSRKILKTRLDNDRPSFHRKAIVYTVHGIADRSNRFPKLASPKVPSPAATETVCSEDPENGINSWSIGDRWFRISLPITRRHL